MTPTQMTKKPSWVKELKEAMKFYTEEPLEVVFHAGIDKTVRAIPWSMFVTTVEHFIWEEKAKSEEDRDRFWRGRIAALQLKEEAVKYNKDNGIGFALPMKYIHDLVGNRDNLTKDKKILDVLKEIEETINNVEFRFCQQDRVLLNILIKSVIVKAKLEAL